MLQFLFTRITFTKASKYVFLVSTQQQTKRTDVCFSWTSSPTFSESILIQESQIDQAYKIKACEATIDRKLKIVGYCMVERKKFTNLQSDNNIVYDNDLQLIQVVEGKDIVVGRCHLQIKRVDEQVQHSMKLLGNSKVSTKQKPFQTQQGIKSLQMSAANSLANSKANSPFNSARLPQQSFESPRQQPFINKLSNQKHKKFSLQQQQQQIDSDFELKSEEEQVQLQNDCSMRFFIHGGTNFYLGSSFSVQIIWCDRYCQTHYIKDKILPQWGESLVLLGNSQQSIIINILDEKKNILESTKFSLSNIKKLYPYHLKIVFREQYMGDRPVLFLSFVREDLPKFTILDKQIRLIVSYQGDNVRNPLQYLSIQSKKQLEVPMFFELDLKKYPSMEQINKLIEGFEIGDYNWNMFMPLQTGKKEIIMFKSQLNKQLRLFLVSIKNWTQVFSNDPYPNKQDAHNSKLSSNRYISNFRAKHSHQQVHAIGKITEIYSETSLAQDKIEDNNTWRTMTKNYILRNNLLNTSITNLELLRTQITNKGQQLIKLKKILAQVKSINTTLKQKEKSTLLLSNSKPKPKLSAQHIKITDIQMILYQKQAQLEFKKKRNQQMTQRMDSLNTMQEDTTELDQQVTKNAKLLLEQQQKIKLMLMVRKQIPKQRQLIFKLQQIFQKLQIDKNMNQLLKEEQLRLNSIRERKREDLKRVYELLKYKNSKQNNLQTKVEQAEQQLIRLNQAYAKLTGL